MDVCICHFLTLLGREMLDKNVSKFSHSFRPLSQYKYLHDNSQSKISAWQIYYQERDAFQTSLFSVD